MGQFVKEVKRFVVLDTGAIIDMATYGMGSWGSHDQCGAEVREGKVYETHWIYREDFEEDVRLEVCLGKIVYSSSNPFYILESLSSQTLVKPDYKEYGADLENNKRMNKK